LRPLSFSLLEVVGGDGVTIRQTDSEGRSAEGLVIAAISAALYADRTGHAVGDSHGATAGASACVVSEMQTERLSCEARSRRSSPLFSRRLRRGVMRP
jgi:hypothetical protein